MNSKLSLLGCVAIAALALSGAQAEDVISDFMKAHHKAPQGIDPTCKKASNGAATDAELAALLKGYQAICGQTPPQGEKDAWVKRCQELVAAVKGMQEKKDGAVDDYKKAVNCKSCHTEFRPE